MEAFELLLKKIPRKLLEFRQANKEGREGNGNLLKVTIVYRQSRHLVSHLRMHVLSPSASC